MLLLNRYLHVRRRPWGFLFCHLADISIQCIINFISNKIFFLNAKQLLEHAGMLWKGVFDRVDSKPSFSTSLFSNSHCGWTWDLHCKEKFWRKETLQGNCTWGPTDIFRVSKMSLLWSKLLKFHIFSFITQPRNWKTIFYINSLSEWVSETCIISSPNLLNSPASFANIFSMERWVPTADFVLAINFPWTNGSFSHLINHFHSATQWETFWCISNITARSLMFLAFPWIFEWRY